MRLVLLRYVSVTAILACLPAAAAELTPYGRIHAAYTYYDSQHGAHGSTVDDARNGSHIGLLVAQPINQGLTGLGRFELGFNPTDFEEDPVHGREAWVALRGGLGQLGVGRFAGIYRTTGGMSWDVMADTVLEQRRNGGMSGGAFGHGGYISRLVEYRLPAIGGLELTIQSGLDDSDSSGASSGDLLFGARYREDNWELIGAYARNSDLQAGENRNWKLGARYAVGAGTLAYQYEKVRIRDAIEAGTVRRDDGDLVLGLVGADEGFSSDARQHFVGISQQLPGAVFWLAWGYLDADDDDFNIQSYTMALRYDGGGGSLGWYAGVQYQDRERGYDAGNLLVTTTGLQFDF